VVTAAESAKVSGCQVSFVNTPYASRAAGILVINQGKVYGAYITGGAGDMLVTVPANAPHRDRVHPVW
jgi:hypothetical protein